MTGLFYMACILWASTWVVLFQLIRRWDYESPNLSSLVMFTHVSMQAITGFLLLSWWMVRAGHMVFNGIAP